MRHVLSSSAVVMVGNVISAAMGFAVLAILTRSLDPGSFGTLAAMINVIDIGLALIDSLLLAGVVVTASRYVGSDPGRSAMALKLGFVLRLVIVAAIGVAALLFAPALSSGLLGSDAWPDEIRYVLIALGLLSLYSFLLSVLQVKQQFGRLGLFTNLKNAARLTAVVVLAMIGQLSVESAAAAFALAAALALVLAALAVRFEFLTVPGLDRAVFAEIFSINRWMALAALGLLGARIDIVMLGHLNTSAEVGYYAAGLQLCLAVTLVSTALVTTLLPKTAQLTDPGQMRAHFLRVLPFLVIAPLGFGLIASISGPLVRLALGPDYDGVVAPFDLLMASALVTLVTNPILMLFFPLNLVSAYAGTTLFQLVMRVGANLFVIPVWGAAGAAGVDLAVKLVTVPVAMVLIDRAIRRRLVGWTPEYGPAAPHTAG